MEQARRVGRCDSLLQIVAQEPVWVCVCVCERERERERGSLLKVAAHEPVEEGVY